MNNVYIFCLWNIDIFGVKLVKNSFTRCWVPFRDFRPFSCPLIYTLSIIVQRCLKSPRFVLHLYIFILVKLEPFRCRARDRKSPPQRKNVANISGKEVDFARNLFRKQHICHQKSMNIQQSFRLGRRATPYGEGLNNVNRNLDKAVYKKEDFKRRDRWRSFSISLVFIRQFWNRVRKWDSCST